MAVSIISRCVVRGRVQGVAYRISCRAEALRLGLHGHAINQPDGSVEVVLMGPEPAVTALQAWLWRGPLLARVETVEILENPPVVMTGFRIG